MKKLFLALTVFLALASCKKEEVDNSVSLLVTQGFSEEIFRSLAADVKQYLDIDIKFVYEAAANQSTLIRQDFMNKDLKADLIFTYAKIPNQYLEDCCVDFVSTSALTTRYSYGTMINLMTNDGCVYQLPLSSRLVGITYNETLMEEMGWKPPQDFQDMLDLKNKCEKAGVQFSITDIKYPGHPFNYLFNLMGSQWLSSVKGDVWFNGFLRGTKTLTTFKEQAKYFKRWVDNGLFGELTGADVSISRYYGQRRALFLFSNRNTAEGYDGPMYDADGHKTDVMLHDTYRTMPWISENGSNNCFTVYNNVWVMANRSLLSAGNEVKLKNAMKVVEYLMTEKYKKMIAASEKDIYLTFDNFTIDESRLYYRYADNIRRGFLQTWYYNSFEDGTILPTGAEIGSYMIRSQPEESANYRICNHINYEYNPFANFDSAIGMLRNSLHAQQEDYLGWAEEPIGAPQIARMVAIAGGMSLQGELDEEVTVGLLPYAEKLSELQPWVPVAVQNARAKEGVLQKAYSHIFEPADCIEVVGIRLTGKEIKKLVDDKYDPTGYFIDKETGKSKFDNKHYGPYPYALAVKDNAPLRDNLEYIVAVPQRAVSSDVYKQFEKDGKVITSKRGTPVTANIGQGIVLYFAQHLTISNTNIKWTSETDYN